jgi:tryptophanyl-tRNA synthetase
MADYLAPIREKREALAKDKDYIQDILNAGSTKARVIAQQTMAQVREALYG